MENKIPIKVLSESEYDRLFEEIRTIPKELNSDEVLKILKEKLPLPVMIAQEMSKATRKVSDIYRIRVLKKGETIKDINNPKEYSYPSKCSIQRCNFENKPVFYGAADPNTPFFEAKKSIVPGKSILYLSKWGIKKECPDPLWCHRMFYGLPENEENIAGILSVTLSKEIRRILPHVPEGDMNRITYFLKKYQDLFTSEGGEYYHITAAIVRDLFKNFHAQEITNSFSYFNMPIFTYPSLAQNKEALNYAITTDFADNYLELKYVDRIILKNFLEDGLELTRFERGFLSNEKIVWIRHSTKLLNNPFVQIQMFKGDSLTEGYTPKSTDHKFLRVSNSDVIYSIREYLYQNGIDINSIAKYADELSKQEDFDFNTSNVFEKETSIALPIENFYIENAEKIKEKIGSIGFVIRYSTGFHFNETIS